MAIDRELLEILACPACKKGVDLTPDGQGLLCSACRRRYSRHNSREKCKHDGQQTDSHGTQPDYAYRRQRERELIGLALAYRILGQPNPATRHLPGQHDCYSCNRQIQVIPCEERTLRQVRRVSVETGDEE